ncbi:Txe/YoeB family addiction module toxin [Anaerococcus lactolyticus]|uniref:Endoribonuclease YoeB n=1 Tax=Anaerococcus lactolyticus S7-1-13 TaxID=1284686 RepID=A0A095Z805_9FIRM|nr:Txe/YoeB family addiction module toxin [Anaerococcus lactolyticus]KGF04619.1 toxin YoeB [Anaerococcus lactolyticus S7-1-13]
MKILFHEKAFDEYLYLQKNDNKTLERLNNIIKDIKRNPYEGLGKPEPLRYALQSYCSRRITLEDRIIYKVENDNLIIISCAKHYE